MLVNYGGLAGCLGILSVSFSLVTSLCEFHATDLRFASSILTINHCCGSYTNFKYLFMPKFVVVLIFCSKQLITIPLSLFPQFASNSIAFSYNFNLKLITVQHIGCVWLNSLLYGLVVVSSCSCCKHVLISSIRVFQAQNQQGNSQQSISPKFPHNCPTVGLLDSQLTISTL